jgi:hypothetical protein
MMNPILSIVDETGQQMHFYPDGTFSGVPEGYTVINRYPLKIRQIQAAIREGLSHFEDWFNRTNGVVFSVGASHGVEPYFDSVSTQSDTTSGGK